MAAIKRTPKSSKSVSDLTVPINKAQFKVVDTDCFGNEYDATTTACAGCADNEVCAILFADKLKEKAKEIQPTPYLDEVNIEAVTDDMLEVYCESNNGCTSSQLLEYVMKAANTIDTTAAMERIKRFKQISGRLIIKQGIVQWN